MSGPLNPKLYRILKQRFGKVVISNEGQRMVVRNFPDPTDMKKTQERIIDSGEYYCVNCPFCNDTRHRLYVNYRWNTYDADGRVYGRKLIHCFNEECDMYHFQDQLQAYIARRPKMSRSLKDVDIYREPMWKDVGLPGLCVPLDQLPPESQALTYLRGRNFDPAELSKIWNVHYCLSCDEDEYGFVPGTKALSRMVRGRIIFPIHWNDMTVGWQARAVGDAHVKYYTMPGLHRNYMLYNGDRARKYDFGVVVEGVLDAIRVGPQAVALFGNTMSGRQRELILSYWGSGGMCIMLDPDAVKQTERISKMIDPRSFRWGSFVMPLPPGKDPGDMDREVLWEMIVNYARTRSIRLTAV
jgi:hypothetical protein